jgi:glycosyltransferase domain-containing protein
MRDFALVIQTHDRAAFFLALLSYLEAEKADCRVIVLDSSCPEVTAVNRARVERSSLDIEYAEFAGQTFDEIRRQGIRKVRTPFCALCADGDVVMLHGLRQCLEALRGDPAASIAKGSSFAFLPLPDGDMELSNLDYPASVEEESPLRRLAQLFDQYQMSTCGTFRTPALQTISDAYRPPASTVFCDLLWSALTAVVGKILCVPIMSYGRRIDRSVTNASWHPLELFCRDPDSLFSDYLSYRELVASAVIQQPDNEQQPDDVRRVLDLIHLRYLIRHAPDAALSFISEQHMAGVDIAQCLPRYQKVDNISSSPVRLRGRERSYTALKSFYAPEAIGPQPLNEIIKLIGGLDSYPPALDGSLVLKDAI